MHVNSIQRSDSRVQNNIMAASAAICAGTAGAIAGYNAAPRAAKNLDELMQAKHDVFYRTIDNMQNSKSIDAVLKTYALLPVKGAINSIEVRVNNAFPGDKIPAADFKTNLKKQEQSINKASEKINTFISSIIKKKGTNMSLEEYFNELGKRDILPKNLINLTKEGIINVIGEDGYKAPNPINDETIDMFKSAGDISLNVSKKELALYKNFIKLEKNGILNKKDMIESAKKDMKPIINDILTGISFDEIKKFVPKTGQTKYALITGGASALLAAIGTKMLGHKE